MSGAAVHSLDHFALSVPDPDAGGAFYTSFGLTSRSAPDALRLETPRGLAGYLYEGPRKRLHHLTFGVDATEFDALKRGLENGAVELLDAPRQLAAAGDGLWFRDPDGNLVQIAVMPNRAPGGKSEMQSRVVPEGRRGAPEGPGRPTPQRLGHTLLFARDVLRSVEFYERFLGLRLADRSGNVVAFMYTPHGSDHHILAFGKAERPGFHHASFEVANVDEIGIGAMYMQALGHNEGWGFGRHYIGSNYFYYVRDPWGSFAEYFCDIDYIPQGCAWEQRDVPSEHALYVWGPPPPDYFFQNVEE